MAEVREILPSTNYRLSTQDERSDQMLSLTRVLMGLSSRLTLVGHTREIDPFPEWHRPPRLDRRWYVVGQQVPKLERYLNGIGIRTAPAESQAAVWERITPRTAYLPDGALAQSLVLRRWPREVAPGWLGNALSSDIPVDVAIHIDPQDPQTTARNLKGQQSWQAVSHASTGDALDELGYEDASRVRRKLVARTDRSALVAIVFTVRANDEATLKRRVETLRSDVGLALGDARLVTLEQDRGLQATSLTGECTIQGAWKSLDCASIASTWMWQPVTVNHANGAPMGTTHEGEMLVSLDPFDESLESFAGIVLAKVGAGKSFFLNLMARRLPGVEVWTVEKRTRLEYAGVPGVHALTLADVALEERPAALKAFIAELFATCQRDPRPRLLILDELWELLKLPSMAMYVEEVARMGRHYYLSLWIATQQVNELLATDEGKAVFNNAMLRVFLKQKAGVDALAKAAELSPEARQFLGSAQRGQALLDVDGMLVALDVQATEAEHDEINTDPRRRVLAAA